MADRVTDNSRVMRSWKLKGCWLFVLCSFFACGNKEEEPDAIQKEPDEDQESTYTNPVFKPVLADPSIVKYEGSFYAYGTEDDWGSAGGYHLVPIIRSEDLVNWTLVGDAFETKPDWKQQGGIWAPDVTEVEGKFYMYYSYSTWGDPNPGLGLAIAEMPAGPFVDQGKVFLSEELGVDNSIDPFYIEEGGKKYLFWGSFHGIYAIELADDGKRVNGEKTLIAHTHLEAAYVYKKDDYYYLFGSEGSCCEGANSTYQVKVGRSKTLLGPYLDKEENDLATGNYGELVIKGNGGNSGFAGPGHNAEIVTDDAGNEWFLYHAISKEHPLLDNGASRRALMLDKIRWERGWPQIEDQQPSTTSKEKPVFNQ